MQLLVHCTGACMAVQHRERIIGGNENLVNLVGFPEVLNSCIWFYFGCIERNGVLQQAPSNLGPCNLAVFIL
eukprot:1159404-Pelagomonas_calceolata.AAC.7